MVTEPDVPWVNAGDFVVKCPECEAEVPLVVRCRLVSNELGQQYVQTDVQTDDLWGHAWTHKGGGSGD